MNLTDLATTLNGVTGPGLVLGVFSLLIRAIFQAMKATNELQADNRTTIERLEKEANGLRVRLAELDEREADWRRRLSEAESAARVCTVALEECATQRLILQRRLKTIPTPPDD